MMRNTHFTFLTSLLLSLLLAPKSQAQDSNREVRSLWSYGFTLDATRAHYHYRETGILEHGEHGDYNTPYDIEVNANEYVPVFSGLNLKLLTVFPAGNRDLLWGLEHTGYYSLYRKHFVRVDADYSTMFLAHRYWRPFATFLSYQVLKGSAKFKLAGLFVGAGYSYQASGLAAYGNDYGYFNHCYGLKRPAAHHLLFAKVSFYRSFYYLEANVGMVNGVGIGVLLDNKFYPRRDPNDDYVP